MSIKNKSELKVLLVDDNPPFRDSLSWALASKSVNVISFTDGESLLAVVDKGNIPAMPCCIVSDVRMPGLSGLELMAELRDRRCQLPFIVITGHGDVTMAVEAMRRGAAGFIEKPFAESILLEAIHSAVADPTARLRSPEIAKARLDQLSRREKQVLALVCAGNANRIIANVLSISVKTVEAHRANILFKMGANNIQQLFRMSMGYD